MAKAAAYLAEAILLHDWAKSNNVRHVHVHFANPAATVANIASNGGHLEYSLSVHGPDEFYDVNGQFLSRKFGQAQLVRCISLYCRSQVLRILDPSLWERVFVVRLGVDIDRFSPRTSPRNQTTELLCVGRLVPAKGQRILLDACASLARRGIPFHLTVAGGGPEREKLEDAARSLGIGERVAFTGAIGQDHVLALYDKADIFVLPSFAEGLPVVLMEAAAKRIPCVSTTVNGIPELIESGASGILVAASDSDALTDVLAGMIRDEQLRETLAEEGLRRVRERYDLNANCLLLAEEFRARLHGSLTAKGGLL